MAVTSSPCRRTSPRDFGVLYYWYPGTYPSGYTKPNTTELYAALTWKWITGKYSYSLNNTFGFPDSKGSDYWELNASYDVVEKVNDAIGKVTVFGHLGKQKFKNNGFYDYGDWKVGVSTEIYGRDGGHVRHRHRRGERRLHQPLRQGHVRHPVRRLRPEVVLGTHPRGGRRGRRSLSTGTP